MRPHELAEEELIPATPSAEEDAALLAERLDDITRLVSDWIWETDAELTLTYVSPRVVEVLGIHPRQLVGRKLLELGRFTLPAGEKSPLDSARRTPFRDLPFVTTNSTGEQRLLRISSLPVFDRKTGSFLGFRGTARDVTDEAEARERVAQSQAQLSTAIETISDGFALFDPNDRLVLCNQRYRAMWPGVPIELGMSFEEIIRATHVAGALPWPESEREQRVAERMQRRVGAPYELKLADGRWFKVSDWRTPDGSIVGIRTDITELKEREQALMLAKEAAEIANRSKSEFLANISHELRTPLNAIIGFSEIMRDEIFGPIGSPQYREYLTDVLDSAHHLLGLINDILDLAKAEAGKLELAEEVVDLPSVARAAIRLVRERADRSGLEIVSTLTDDLPFAYADERKLKQILLNLLSNAVKFTPEGGTVEVSAAIEPAGDLVLAVRDTGIGIAPEDIAVALAPFGQVEGSLNRKHEGTGLGLPLCRAMTELHGGQLAIESTVGAGTTVRVRLPAVRLVRRPNAA
jgi:PAS domain S-box-containing protein